MVNTTKEQRLLNEEVNGIWAGDSTSQEQWVPATVIRSVLKQDWMWGIHDLSCVHALQR